MKIRIVTLNLFAVVALFSFNAALAAGDVGADGRINTFLYDENEVFEVVMKHGYQTNIEFGDGEKILTLSLGDPAAFKVTPAKNRIFIKTLQDDRHTNMTVITNFRTYLFDLTSKLKKNQNAMYVARFFFPEEELGYAEEKAVAAQEIDSMDGLIDNMVMGGNSLDDLGSKIPDIDSITSDAADFNFNYSLSGPEEFAPLKVFDDGKSTFFKFSSDQRVLPEFFQVSNDGIMIPILSKIDGEYVVVNAVLEKTALRSGSDIICVFNENIL